VRERVERVRSGVAPKGLRGAIERGYLTRESKIVAARTGAIDDAVRDARSPQLVILGAGLDGRAWRMPELSDVVVFEVSGGREGRETRSHRGRDTGLNGFALAGLERLRSAGRWEGEVPLRTRHDVYRRKLGPHALN
jgi:hypothetical protein